MNRKQKAMEEAYLRRKEPKVKDMREIATLGLIQRLIRNQRKRGYGESLIREGVSFYFKNGAELFDLAIEIENSPLMKALR